MVKRYRITGWDYDIEDNLDGSYVDYEDYQKLEEENRVLRRENKFLKLELSEELGASGNNERIDTTPANEIVYPWGLYSEEKNG